MSLNFGYSKETGSVVTQNSEQKRALNYQVHYEAISKTMSEPYSLNSGYPHNIMFRNANLKEDAEFVILSHTFDSDDTITTLKLKYYFMAYKLDGTTDTVEFDDVDYSLGNIRVGNTFFLGNEYKFKDIYQNYKLLIGFLIKFKQLSNESYGNESVMDIMVDF